MSGYCFIADYSEKSTARRTTVDSAVTKVSSEVLKRNIANSYAQMFFIQDLGESINNSFMATKTPQELLIAAQNGLLGASLEEDRNIFLYYLKHMSDWHVEEVQMSHFAHKNGMSVIRHIEREKYGETAAQNKFYEKSRIDADKEDKKTRKSGFFFRGNSWAWQKLQCQEARWKQLQRKGG